MEGARWGSLLTMSMAKWTSRGVLNCSSTAETPSLMTPSAARKERERVREYRGNVVESTPVWTPELIRN